MPRSKSAVLKELVEDEDKVLLDRRVIRLFVIAKTHSPNVAAEKSGVPRGFVFSHHELDNLPT